MSFGTDWNIFEVFIASPGNLENERDAVERTIQQWNTDHGETMRTLLLSRRWEQLSPSQIDAQDYINRAQVERADILIAFFDKKAGRGTVKEIDLFLSSGKSRTTMVYFKANQPHTSELDELIQHLQSRGLTGKFSDATDLAKQVREHLTSAVGQLLKYPRHSWPRLKSAVADIQNHAPHLLARFLIEELLRKAAEEMEHVRNEARSFEIHPGYPGYQQRVHQYLEHEKKGHGTTVFAICGEKGLRDDDEAVAYFQKFYDFPDSDFKENQVFRVFVELPEGQRHNAVTDRVIGDHERACQVVPLRVSRDKRISIDQKFPGLCPALDEGFGLVLFVRPDKSKVAIVHQGVLDDFTFAVFKDHTNVVKHLMAMTYQVYRASNEYRSRDSLKKEIDSLFSTGG